MLPASRRVRRRHDFAAALRGFRAGGPLMTVHMAVPDAATGKDDSGTVRVGFIVSKAVGKAVVRNRVKRRLRHMIADRTVGFPPGAVVLIRASRQAASASGNQLGEALDDAIARVIRASRTVRTVSTNR
jgi:ribonuclease P protein component